MLTCNSLTQRAELNLITQMLILRSSHRDTHKAERKKKKYIYIYIYKNTSMVACSNEQVKKMTLKKCRVHTKKKRKEKNHATYILKSHTTALETSKFCNNEQAGKINITKKKRQFYHNNNIPLPEPYNYIKEKQTLHQ